MAWYVVRIDRYYTYEVEASSQRETRSRSSGTRTGAKSVSPSLVVAIPFCSPHFVQLVVPEADPSRGKLGLSVSAPHCRMRRLELHSEAQASDRA